MIKPTKEEIYKNIKKDSPHLNWLEKSTILLTISGSRAYGTHTSESDYDFKGVAIPPKEYFFTSKIFEQSERKDPDLVIYDIKKFFNLAAGANPNIIEVLFTEPEDHLILNDLGEELLKNRNIFLSKKLKHSFMGYAWAQFKRMEFHHRMMKNPPLEPPKRNDFGLPEKTIIPKDQLEAAQSQIAKKLEEWSTDYLGELSNDIRIAITNKMSEQLAEMQIYSDTKYLAAARSIGYDENFIYLLDLERRYNSKLKEWQHYLEWKNNRNIKRAELEAKFGFDTKNAYHLVRLTRMAQEIMETGKVNVKRKDFQDFLDIRNGKLTYEEIYEYINVMENKLNTLYKTSNILPNAPDSKKIDELCMKLIERSFDI